MNILVTCLSRAWGGMEMFAISSLKLLIKEGYHVSAACLAGSPIHKELVKSDIPVEVFKPSIKNIGNLFKFINILNKKKYNLIHTHFSKDLWLVIPALKLINSNIPVILTKHLGSAISKKDFFHNIIYNRLDYAIAISDVIKKNLLDTTALTENKIALINNYIDLSKYTFKPEAKERLRREFSIADDTMVFGVVARITPGKGHEEVIEAVREISKENLNFKVVVAGTSSPDEKGYEQGLKNLVRQYGIENYFIFTGFRSDVPDLMSLFDVFLFPSRAEAFGLALVEAMAAGLPNIVCYSDGVTDIAVKDETSLTFGRQDYQALASNIKKIYYDGELRRRLGENSYYRAQLFSPMVFQDKINMLYENALAKYKEAEEIHSEILHDIPPVHFTKY